MNKSISRTPKEGEITKTYDEVISAYESTIKKLELNVVQVKPNFCIGKQIELAPPIIMPNGEKLIVASGASIGDELVFEVILTGEQNNDSSIKVSKGDLVIIRHTEATCYKPTTRLKVDGIEIPVFAFINTYDILYKVDYKKI